MRWIDRTEFAIRLIGVTAAAVLLPLLMIVRVLEISLRTFVNVPTSLYNAMERELFVLLIFLIIGPLDGDSLKGHRLVLATCRWCGAPRESKRLWCSECGKA